MKALNRKRDVFWMGAVHSWTAMFLITEQTAVAIAIVITQADMA